MFVNIFTADDKYSLLNRDNLRQPIHMQLSQKEKTFSEFASAYLKSILKFEHSTKRINLITSVFPKLGAPKNVVKQISKKSLLREPFNKQYAKGEQTLSKSELQHL